MKLLLQGPPGIQGPGGEQGPPGVPGKSVSLLFFSVYPTHVDHQRYTQTGRLVDRMTDKQIDR